MYIDKIIAIMLVLVIALSGCVTQSAKAPTITNDNAKIPNPAAVKCSDDGLTYEIREDAKGNQVGICILPDGLECDAWEYYRGECPAVLTGSQLGNPASIKCENDGYKLDMRKDADGGEYGACVFPNGTECEEWAYFRGECSPGLQKKDIKSFDEVTSKDIVKAFIEMSPTYMFDGFDLTFKSASALRCEGCYEITYKFKSRNGGHGDRTGQMVTKNISTHEIVVTIEQGQITRAIIDNEWNVLEQRNTNREGKTFNQEENERLAKWNVKSSITYEQRKSSMLKLTNTAVAFCEGCYEFTYAYESEYPGYGKIDPKAMLLQKTEHIAILTMENGKVTKHVLDGTWDELNYQEYSEPLTGARIEVYTEEQSKTMVEGYIQEAPTFSYDGSELEYVSTNPLRCTGCYEFTYKFESTNAGYGNRLNQFVAQGITSHEIVVTIEQGRITRAIIDNQWDELNQWLFPLPTEEESKTMAKEFIEGSSTYQFDGSKLVLKHTAPQRCPSCWLFTYEFECASAGYGDRNDKVTAQVITPHIAKVQMSQGTIDYAYIDDKWDMVNQKELGE